MKRPSLQWYPNDWLNDLALRQCSALARAVWIDLLCIMHQGDPYGYLRSASGKLPDKFLAGACGVTTKQLSDAVKELEGNGVFSRDEAGMIYSRRMVKDERTRMLRAAGGYRSVEHPKTLKPLSKGTHVGSNNAGTHPPEEEEEDVAEEETKSGSLNENSLDAHRFPDEFDFPAWFEVRISRHPKPQDRNIAAQYIRDRMTAGTIDLQRFGEVHDAWCEYWKADNSERYAPSLAKFVYDKWDLKLPPKRGAAISDDPIDRAKREYLARQKEAKK